jgi:hypothetical protein
MRIMIISDISYLAGARCGIRGIVEEDRDAQIRSPRAGIEQRSRPLGPSRSAWDAMISIIPLNDAAKRAHTWEE